MAAPLENLETQLELFIENVRQIRIIVSDFQPQGQNVLNQKMQVYTAKLVIYQLIVCHRAHTRLSLAPLFAPNRISCSFFF